MYGTDYEYAATRLVNTIVRHNDKLVEVLGINRANGHCTVRQVSAARQDMKVVPLDELNLKPLRLGYANLNGGGAIFICRVPRRDDWRQGTRAANLKVCVDGFMNFEWPLHILVDVVANKYPKFKTAVTRSRNTGKRVAWAREWAVQGGMVFNKDRVVGRMNDKNEITLNEGYTYLQESLTETLV